MNTFRTLQLIALIALSSAHAQAADHTRTVAASQEKTAATALVLPQIVIVGKRLTTIEKIRLVLALPQDPKHKDLVAANLANRKD